MKLLKVAITKAVHSICIKNLRLQIILKILNTNHAPVYDFCFLFKINYSHKHVVKPQFSLTKEWTDLDSLTSLVLFANNNKTCHITALCFFLRKKFVMTDALLLCSHLTTALTYHSLSWHKNPGENVIWQTFSWAFFPCVAVGTMIASRFDCESSFTLYYSVHKFESTTKGMC